MATSVQLRIIDAPKAVKATWKILEKDGVTSLSVTSIGSEEMCTMYPASGCPAVSFAAPELIDPSYVAVGVQYVHWLMELSEGRFYVLSQLVEDANGGAHGVRRMLVKEGTEGGDAGFDLSGPVWSSCAARQTLPTPWWFAEVSSLAKPSSENPTLPSSIRTVQLSHSSMVWQMKTGWDSFISPGASPTFLMLYENTLFFSATPDSKDVQEYGLTSIDVVPGDISISAGSVVQYPLTLNNKNGKTLGFTFHSQGERDLWAALLEVAAAQIQPKKKISKQKAALYEAILVLKPAPPCTPAVSPHEGAAPENDPNTLLTGYIIIEVNDSSAWFAQGWKRMFVTLHTTFITFRTHRDTLSDLRVLSLRHITSAKVPQEKNPWVIGLFSPFSSPLMLWCDTKEIFSTWLSGCDKAIRSANHGVAAGHPISVDRVKHSSAEDLLKTVQSAKGVVVLKHNLPTPNGAMQLPYAQESSWRIFETVDGLIGSDDAEAEFYFEEKSGKRAVRWVEASEGNVIPDVEPHHVLVRGNGAGEVGDKPAECMLPNSVLGGSVLAELGGAYRISSTTLTKLPAGVEQTLRYSEFFQWFVVLEGSVRVVMFSGTCYTLITKDYPKVTASSYNKRIGNDWAAEGSPLSVLGGRQVVVSKGETLYVYCSPPFFKKTA